jgi:Mn-dependent DtxR family transcriptional regulator
MVREAIDRLSSEGFTDRAPYRSVNLTEPNDYERWWLSKEML